MMSQATDTNRMVGSRTGSHFNMRTRFRPIPVIYMVFALELFLLATVFWGFWAVRHSYPAASDQLISIPWSLLTIAAAVWGSVYLGLAWKSLRRRRLAAVRQLMAIALSCGLVVAGCLLVAVARASLQEPAVVDVTSYYQRAATDVATTAAASEPATGDPENGKSVFVTTCSSCHGQNAAGVAGNAPSLRTSEFLAAADEPTIAALIRNGRAATDPANQSGKVMPARGGNPFLDDAKIRDIAAFLKDLDAHLGDAPAEATASDSPIVDFSQLQADLGEFDLPTVRKWSLGDFSTIEPSRDAESVARGMRAFVKASCHKCHYAAEGEIPLGPGLVEIVAKNYPAEKLIQHIVDPSAEIHQDHLSHSFLLTDGRMVTGVIREETPQSITVVTDLLKPTELSRIDKEDIEDRRQSSVSAMPTGLVDVLEESEIIDLLAYVGTGGGIAQAAPIQPTQWILPPASEATLGMAEMPPQVMGIDFADRSARRIQSRYQSMLTGLFAVASTVLAFHFLWVVSVGAGCVIPRTADIQPGVSLRAFGQAACFWITGVGLLVVWFVLFVFIS